MRHDEVWCATFLETASKTQSRRGFIQGKGMIESRVAIIILNWNGCQDTLDCLESLRVLKYKNHHVMVVDNGSEDDSIARIHFMYPQVEVIAVGQNLGFSKGNNLAIRLALERNFAFVWLLNNDTTVDANSLSALVAMSGDGIGIVGSVLYEAADPDRIQAWGGGRLNMFLGSTTQFQSEPAAAIQHILGTSMLIPCDVLRQVGLLNEEFFFYMEDTEFSWRVRRHGYTLKVAAQSKVVHKGGSSVNRGNSGRSMLAELHFARGNGLFMGLYGEWYSVLAVPVRLLAVIIQRARRGQLSRVPAIHRAFFEGFRHGRFKRASGTP
jgi:GT2 family glycosyltransferase